MKSFVNNGWCVQIRGPQAGGAVKDLPIHLYDLGTGNRVKIPSEVMIPETREFEFASTGFYPAVVLQNRDYACFFGQLRAETGAVRYRRRHRQQPYQRASALHLPAVAHRALPEDDPAREYRHTTKDRRLLELELNTGCGAPVTEMTDPGDELQAPIRCAMPAWWWKISRITRASSA